MANTDITGLLAAWRHGDRAAFDKLLPLVYDELRFLARRQLAGQYRRTLQTTDLVHDAYLKLAAHSRLNIQDRRHFFAIAARAMRQLVVDHARRQTAQKRGGPGRDLLLDEGQVALDEKADEIVALDEALDRLAAVDERLSRVVELRFFAGLSVEEAAEVLDSSPRTVKRDWRKARAFLHGELVKGGLGRCESYQPDAFRGSSDLGSVVSQVVGNGLPAKLLGCGSLASASEPSGRLLLGPQRRAVAHEHEARWNRAIQIADGLRGVRLSDH